MAGGASSGDDGLIAEINVTPLVDVVLVLLIILMVTATAIAGQSIPVDLPRAAGPTEQVSESITLTISIDADGALYLDGEAISARRFRTRVQEARAETENVHAMIAGDAQVPYERVVFVIDQLRLLGVTKFAINVAPEATPDPSQ